MADQDELYYLQPGFDVNTLTVPRLRSILVAHNVNYPSSAKKSELVEILQTELIPKARKLLRDRDRVRRTSRGITDVPSSQESTVDDDESDAREQMPPPPAPKTPRGRKSRTNLQQEEVEPTPKTTRRSKTPSKRRSTKAAPVSDAETTGTEPERVAQSVKRTRKSTPGPIPVTRTPSVKVRDAPDTRRSLEADESPFTQDNPFQSPDPDTIRVSSSKSRKSMGTSSTRKSTSRRRTRSPTRVKKEGVDVPVAHLSTGADGVETTEEFTEDASQELSQDIVADRRLAKSRNKDIIKHRKKPASTTAKTAPWAILMAALSATAAWYRQEKVAVGYCGVGQPQWSLAEIDNVPYWVHESLQPQCEPCPQNALCYPNMQVECEHDFVLKQHPLSLNGLVPLPPTCEPDSEKEKRIRVVADRAVEELRNKRAAYECGDLTLTSSSTTATSTQDQASRAIVSPTKLEVSEEQLKATISKQRRKNMSPEEFDDLWESALGDIKKRDEIEVTHDKSGRTLLSSTSFANLPFTCAVRRSTVRTLAANRVPIFFVILSIASALYGRQRLLAYSTAKTQTPSLVAMTLDRLATQAALKEDGRVGEAFISVGQLRDDVLRNVFDRAERERAWVRVKKIVEANSNVRAATREGGKTGEWSRVWEWIGPVNLVPGLEGRRSGGMIENGSSPAGPSRGGTPSGDERKGLEVRKWDEGRAIY
ncbi:inner nuclear membrane protein enriched at telomere/subtelomere region [Knufia obscura]|uniref:Inner nuclear membrane protein enriched at telomere/subtelomere region n=1 Tax=Knufia obscura TaxID=1635080 RepID=A0ABR0S282_9EURO|nr:inner nuclear membrane protein enriched at telomere/subtelomere region [Knufia obscura]